MKWNSVYSIGVDDYYWFKDEHGEIFLGYLSTDLPFVVIETENGMICGYLGRYKFCKLGECE